MIFLALLAVAWAETCDNSVDLLQRKLQVNDTQVPKKPNFLFLVVDQWRWDWTGLDQPIPVQMPTVKQLASQGLRFTRAYTVSPMCVPARSALAAVREYKNSHVKNNSDIPEGPNLTTTFMTALQKAGYTTMMAGKDHLFLDMVPGVSADLEHQWMQQVGFDYYHRSDDKYMLCDESEPHDGYGMWLNQTEGLFKEQCSYYGRFDFPDEHPEGISCRDTPVFDLLSVMENGFRCELPDPLDETWSPDAYVRSKAVELLRQHATSTSPWFLQVNFLGVHPPFILKPSSIGKMKELENQLPPAIDTEPHEILVFDDDDGPKLLPFNRTFVNVSASRLQYATLLHQIDGEIKEILDTVKELGHWDHTIIALTGDHGEHLGDHGHFGKLSPWESASHVPLILAGEPVPQNVENHWPVSLIDIPMTFLDLAGAAVAPSMQGHSLVPAFSGSRTSRPAVMFGLDSWESPWPAAGYSPGILRFDAAAARFEHRGFLKLVCCPHGCRKHGSLLPLPIGPQVVLMNITKGTGKHRFEHNILNQPPGNGVAEALYLVAFLADEFREICEPLLRM